MAKFMSDALWAKYQGIVEDFIDQDAGLQEITWKKRRKWQGVYGEDSEVSYDDIQINVLAQYNFFRTWPINLPSVAGERDKTSFAIYITRKQLSDIPGALDENGYFNFHSTLDRFVIEGKWYIAKGDTKVAQAKGDAFLFEMILERIETENEII